MLTPSDNLNDRHERSPSDSNALDSSEISRLALNLRSYNEVQNLISRKSFLAGSFRADSELQLFADMEDTSWGDNKGFWIGLKSIKKFLFTWYSKFPRVPLGAESSNSVSELTSSTNNPLNGLFRIPLLTTPLIHISADGITAKAMWYSPGLSILPTSGAESSLVAKWEWKKLAVDFIVEGKQWKIWHYNELTDWTSEFTTSPTAETCVTESDSKPLPPHDLVVDRYQRWYTSRIPTLYPQPPVAYETFSNTFSYGPDEHK